MRKLEEKTVGLDLILHSELKKFCNENKIQIKDAVMNALTIFLIRKRTIRDYERDVQLKNRNNEFK
tara:strand:- start:8 stop:205 length:198 start_codon:yes stop_codon:yes gene_type:complete